MHIIVIGDYRGRSDEGLRQLTRVISDGAQQNHLVLRVSARTSVFPKVILEARQFSPNIVHYVPGPTLRSFLVLWLYKRSFRGCTTISSATRPFFSRKMYPFIAALKPDLVLTQDPRWEKVFRSHGVNTQFLPNGIDLTRFRSVTSQLKVELRMKLGLPLRQNLVLHVGHISKNRNIKLLILLQRTGIYQVVVIASTALGTDQNLQQELKDAGCIVITDFQKHIEEIYACADYFVFPVIPTKGEELPKAYHEVGVIDTPLSILEAMACNLPIVTTRFLGLERSLGPECEDDSFRWFDGSLEDCIAQLNEIKIGKVDNRRKVQHLDLSKVLTQLNAVYGQAGLQN